VQTRPEAGAILMSDPSRRAAQREGEALKLAMTSLVERFKPVWTRRIQRAFLGLLIEQQTGTTDDIRSDVDVPPESGTAIWGAAVQGLAQARLIRRLDYVTSSRPERHGCPIGLWTLAVEHADVRRWLDAHPDLHDPEPDDAEAPEPCTPTPPSPGRVVTYQAMLF
jgi:hypothetical protein